MIRELKSASAERRQSRYQTSILLHYLISRLFQKQFYLNTKLKLQSSANVVPKTWSWLDILRLRKTDDKTSTAEIMLKWTWHHRLRFSGRCMVSRRFSSLIWTRRETSGQVTQVFQTRIKIIYKDYFIKINTIKIINTKKQAVWKNAGQYNKTPGARLSKLLKIFLSFL